MGKGPQQEVYKLRPKYGLVVPRSYHNLQPLVSIGAEPKGYGNIIIVMKDEVKRRTTWYLGDSLASDQKLGLRVGHTFQYNEMPAHGKDVPFIEAHIWGEVDVRDIAKILVPRTMAKDTLKAMKAFGVPIFTHKPYRKYHQIGPRSLNAGRWKHFVVPSRKQYAGDPQQLEQYSQCLERCRVLGRGARPNP